MPRGRMLVRVGGPLLVLLALSLLSGDGWGQPAPPGTTSPGGAPAPPRLGLSLADERFFPAARTAGIRAVKVLADWSVIEAQRGQMAWTALDRVIAGAEREGLAPVVVLAHTPRWASIGTGADLMRPEIYTRQPPRDLRDWERFVAAVADRYRVRIADWQVWTQIGLPSFRGTGLEYLRLLQTARARLRAVHPTSRVAMATPAGVDLGFILGVAQQAPHDFDVVSLAPQGLAPENLLRPLSVLAGRLRAAGKAVWLDWTPEASVADQDRAGTWARLLAVSQAGGLERVFLLDPAQMGADLGAAAAAVLSRPYAGYLVREPEAYAVVLGFPADAALVAWARAEGRVLDLSAFPEPGAVTLDGKPVATEVREGRTVVRLGATPVVVRGVPPAVVEEARSTAGSRGPLVPAVPPERDYGRAAEVAARLGRPGEERGLYNTPYRTRSNGAVEPVEVGGVEAVSTRIVRQAIYVYFDIDDTFLYFAEGRVPLEITVEVWGARGPRQVGFNLLYDSTGGYRFTPWQWVDVREGWVTYTIRLADASMANTWGFDFAINAAGNRSEDLVVRAVSVRKPAP